jgi:hypothetical protein
MSVAPICWRPLGRRDLAAGETLFAGAIASWQDAWFVEPVLSVEGAALLDPLASFATQDKTSAWSCGQDVWLFADPRELARMVNRALDLPTRFAPSHEPYSVLLRTFETQLVDELFDALRHALSPALQSNDCLRVCEAPTPLPLPYGGAHFRLVTPSGDTVLSLVSGAQTLCTCLPLHRPESAALPGHMPSNRTAAAEDSRVSLRAMLGQCELTAAQLATLAVGDVIRLDYAISEAVALELTRPQRARRTVVATGKPGQRAGKLSIQLTSIARPDKP